MGVFGYVAFYDEALEGNILVSFPSTFLALIMQIGFLLSVILSYPLLVFPCRFSIYALFFAHEDDKSSMTTIPHRQFYLITCGIVLSTLVVGIFLPHSESLLELIITE